MSMEDPQEEKNVTNWWLFYVFREFYENKSLSRKADSFQLCFLSPSWTKLFKRLIQPSIVAFSISNSDINM